MHKKVQVFFLVIIFSSSVFLSLLICHVVARTYFFDSLFYYKSVDLGYWVPGKNLTLDDFGMRAHDIAILSEHLYKKTKPQSWHEFGNYDDSMYTIVLIGDSYAWGQGVETKNTLPFLLEKELSKHKKTRVIKLYKPGDSLLEYVTYYEAVKELRPDLFVFVIVTNDILPNDFDSDYHSVISSQILNECKQRFGNEVIHDPNLLKLGLEEGNKILDSIWDKLWISEGNLCLLESLLFLPTENALYFPTDNYDYGFEWNKYLDALENKGKKIVDIKQARETQEYRKFWKNPNAYFFVSRLDQHPSSLAHNMYTFVLKNHIVSNHFKND